MSPSLIGYGRVTRTRREHGDFHTQRLRTGGGEERRGRTREGEEATGQNLGRPAPRVLRKLGQVFCTCRSNAGTFATVFIAILFLFAIPVYPTPLFSLFSPLRQWLLSSFVFSRPRCHASWKSFHKPAKKTDSNQHCSSYLPLIPNWTRCWINAQFLTYISVGSYSKQLQ